MNKKSKNCDFKKLCACASCSNQKCSDKSCAECEKEGKAYVSKDRCPKYNPIK